MSKPKTNVATFNPPVKPVKFEIPTGYELAETEPRLPKRNELFMSILAISGEIRVETYDKTWKSNDLHDHPVLGKKRFILKKIAPKFEPKMGDLIEIDNDESFSGCDGGCDVRIFLRMTSEGHFCCLQCAEGLHQLHQAFSKMNGSKAMFDTCIWKFARKPVKGK